MVSYTPRAIDIFQVEIIKNSLGFNLENFIQLISYCICLILLDNANIILRPNNVGIIILGFNENRLPVTMICWTQKDIQLIVVLFCENEKLLRIKIMRGGNVWKFRKNRYSCLIKLIDNTEKRISIKTNAWCYDFKVRYKIKGCFRQGIDFEYSTSLFQYHGNFIWINVDVKSQFYTKAHQSFHGKTCRLICPPHILTS